MFRFRRCGNRILASARIPYVPSWLSSAYHIYIQSLSEVRHGHGPLARCVIAWAVSLFLPCSIYIYMLPKLRVVSLGKGVSANSSAPFAPI